MSATAAADLDSFAAPPRLRFSTYFFEYASAARSCGARKAVSSSAVLATPTCCAAVLLAACVKTPLVAVFACAALGGRAALLNVGPDYVSAARSCLYSGYAAPPMRNPRSKGVFTQAARSLSEYSVYCGGVSERISPVLLDCAPQRTDSSTSAVLARADG